MQKMVTCRAHRCMFTENSSTVKGHVFRKWLHAEHIDACSGWKMKISDNVTENSSTVKRHLFRKWLHAEHIDACSGCKRRLLIILLKIVLL